PGMARDLLATDAAFRAALERCDAALAAATGWSVAVELARDPAASRLEQTRFAGPAIFAIQVALAEALAGEGARPDAVFGQSIGEIAAAVVAGALDLAEGARVIARWTEVVGAHAGGRGGMLVAGCAPADAAALADGLDGVAIAGQLSTRQTCLAG